MQGFSNEQAIIALLLTTVAGMSTGLGGLLSFASIGKSDRALRNALSFSAGVMICVSLAEMLPTAYSAHLAAHRSSFSSALLTIFAFAGGALLVAAGRRLISLPQILRGVKAPTAPGQREGGSLVLEAAAYPSYRQAGARPSQQKLVEMSALTALAIAMHNFPEGIAVFMTNMSDLETGLVVTFAILLHNIPEGIAVAIPVLHASGSAKRAFGLSLFSGLTEPIGALLAFLVLYPFLNETMLAIAMAGVAGIMIFISVESLLPMAFRSSNSDKYEPSYSFIAGVTVMILSLLPNFF